jgi:hypothetical protein
MPIAVDQLRRAGFEIVVARMGEEAESFRDVAALIWYLRAVNWAIPGFDLAAHDAALRRIHEAMEEEPLVIRQRRFWLVAKRR